MTHSTVGHHVGRIPADAVLAAIPTNAVTIYEDADFGGRSKTLAPGGYRFFTPDDLNDVISSIRVPAGLCATLYEHADDGGGYGISVDLLEDCPDLSVYGFNDKVSYVNVFPTTNGQVVVRDHRGGGSTTTTGSGLIYVRNRMVNGQFVAGHWERQRASGAPDNGPPAVVSPPYPPHLPTAPTVMQVNGAQTVISFLGAQTPGDSATWEHAVSEQMDVIGSDFRGPEEIGSACFQRASGKWYIPDFINFWYPQKQPNDHRSVVYFKRTLVGKVQGAEPYNQTGTYQDFDVDIYVVPNDKYMYLVTQGHKREYTDIMKMQWELSAVTGSRSGKPDCDDEDSIRESGWVEAEIQPDSDPDSGTALKLAEMVRTRAPKDGQPAKDVGVYGTWIYDKGHCCHSEIHPAEQIWWRDDVGDTQKVYTCCLFVDASKRFWWRDQMDDGTKLKPWGAPPVRGIFAIAFEAELGKPAVRFEVANIDDYNVTAVSNGDQTYNLVYQNNVLVSFVPHNDAFRVSFENVGMTAGNKVRGFLVLETTVGTVTQTKSRIVIPPANPRPDVNVPPVVIDIPEGTDVNSVDQRFEREAFKKVEGRYMFTVTRTHPRPLVGRGGLWDSDFLHVLHGMTPTS
jgi:hypothetical protein